MLRISVAQETRPSCFCVGSNLVETPDMSLQMGKGNIGIRHINDGFRQSLYSTTRKKQDANTRA